MLKNLMSAAVIAGVIGFPAHAQDVSYTKDIAPLFKEWCSECHGADSPQLQAFKLEEKKFTKEKTGPRMNSYDELIAFIGWPDTGALMRRLDDGKSVKGGKPGNMYRHLGSDDAERQKNLATVKAWVGEGAWNLNRFKARGDVPAITKEQLDKLKLKY
ncbi:MAG: cytochrome C [Burkholderiales bacterium]